MEKIIIIFSKIKGEINFIISILMIFCNSLFCESSKIKIIEIDDISKACFYFDNADSDTLILFDIDSTLTIPSDPCLGRAAIKENSNFYQKNIKRLNKLQLRTFYHLLVLSNPSALTEISFVHIIKNLQGKGVKTLACTASKMGSIPGVVTDFSKWRFNELKRLDIDFSKDFPGKVCFELFSAHNECPGIEKGIIFCDHFHQKAKLFEITIKTLNFMPKKLIVIDDKKKILEEFSDIIEHHFPHISFIGIHYTKVEKNKNKCKISQKKFEEKIKSFIDLAIKIS